MIIRKAAVEDVDAIARVNVLTWQSSFRGVLPDELLDSLSIEDREQVLRKRFEHLGENFFAYAAVDEAGELFGYALGGPERDGDLRYKGEVYAIYVLKAVQQSGVGRNLLRALVSDLKGRGLLPLLIWTLEGNPSRGFYDAMDGKVVHRRQLDLSGYKTWEVGYGWEDPAIILGE